MNTHANANANTSTNKEYSPLAKWLHWSVAALIIVQYLLIEFAEIAEHSSATLQRLALLANHKSIGMTILGLALIRLLVRFIKPAPALPNSMPSWQKMASHASHAALYLLLFSLPITGWLMSSASAYSVSWFNLFAFPDLIAASEANANSLVDWHERLSDLLLVVAVLHILAALKHHFVDRDTVLKRMSSIASLSLFTVTLIGGLLLFGELNNKKNSPPDTAHATATSDTQTASAAPADSATPAVSQSKLPVWQIDYANSSIEFTGEQAGAPFTGQWTDWQASLQFDENQLDQSRFNVTINVNAVNSNDQERDDTIISEEFFNALNFPKASFKANEFSAEQHSFTANGELTMKGIKQPAQLTFTVEKNGKQLTLIGQSTLNRHTWLIGEGDWEDSTWVGSEVQVEVLVTASLPIFSN